MADAASRDFIAFNEELRALLDAGLPIDIGVAGTKRQIADKLARIDSSLSLRITRGQDLQQAIDEEIELPPRYRAALRTWIRAADPSVALDGVSSPAEARRVMGHNVGRLMIYPLIIFSLTYVACLYLCSYTVPKLESFYGQLWQQPSQSLVALIALRDAMPLWGPLIPLLVILFVVWWRLRASSMAWSWVPGSERYYQSVRGANTAQQLAALLDSGASLDESMKWVAPMTGKTDRAAATGQLSEAFPPLLRWAVRGDLAGEPLPSILRFVAQTYQQRADRQQAIWRVVVPTLCGVFLGGAIVLAYGLGLFLPVIQMLKDVSMPEAF